MSWLGLIDTERFLIFTLVLTRVSGLFLTAPVYGTKEAPMMVRALLSFSLALLVMPSQWNASFADPGTMLQYLVVIGGELLIGVCLGLGILILLSGMQMAGDLISRIGGLSLSEVFDPTFDNNIPLFSRLLFLVSTAVFILMGGHRVVMAALLDTFQVIPPGEAVAIFLPSAPPAGGGFLQSLAETMLLLVAQSCELSIRVSAPVVTSVLLATLVLGLISRTLPQLNVLMVGFGLNSMLTFGVFSISLGAAMLVFERQIEPTLQTLFETLRVPIHPL